MDRAEVLRRLPRPPEARGRSCGVGGCRTPPCTPTGADAGPGSDPGPPSRRCPSPPGRPWRPQDAEPRRLASHLSPLPCLPTAWFPGSWRLYISVEYDPYEASPPTQTCTLVVLAAITLVIRITYHELGSVKSCIWASLPVVVSQGPTIWALSFYLHIPQRDGWIRQDRGPRDPPHGEPSDLPGCKISLSLTLVFNISSLLGKHKPLQRQYPVWLSHSSRNKTGKKLCYAAFQGCLFLSLLSPR